MILICMVSLVAVFDLQQNVNNYMELYFESSDSSSLLLDIFCVFYLCVIILDISSSTIVRIV